MRKINEIHWMLAVTVALILVAVVVAFWQGTQPSTYVTFGSVTSDTEVVNEPIQPIPLSTDLNQNKVALGKRLFQEPQLSGNNTISCSSCHALNAGGVDHLQRPLGINGQTGLVNTPTVYNSSLNFRQFWDGRAATLNVQVSGPIHNPLEMGSNWDDIVKRLKASPNYVSDFSSLYSDGITPDNISDAIATFERSLVTPNSRFDQYLRGNAQAITADELKGYNLFKGYGCVSCHQGVNVGGNMYQRMGIVADYFADRGKPTNADLGLFNVTGKDEDRYVFKVPSLRMAALTAPYFHDGEIPTLDGAVKAMAHYQLGRSISDEDVNLIVQFLKTLPGDNVELSAGR